MVIRGRGSKKSAEVHLFEGEVVHLNGEKNKYGAVPPSTSFSAPN